MSEYIPTARTSDVRHGHATTCTTVVFLFELDVILSVLQLGCTLTTNCHVDNFLLDQNLSWFDDFHVTVLLLI